LFFILYFADFLDMESKNFCSFYSVQILITCLWVIMWTGVITQLKL